MKVVLFCGGLGTRLREHTDTIPKPMVNIGARPILWHLMKYYAHFGHTEFILCLGYRGDMIKRYFVNYAEWLSNDFRLSDGGRSLHLYNSDIADWKITFADTGANASIGERLRAVRHYLEDDADFLANYSDGLSDLPLADYVEQFRRDGRIASFTCVRPGFSFHTVTVGKDRLVQKIRQASGSDFWINGGFFALKREIFDHIKAGEDLVAEPLQRLIDLKQLTAYRHTGFWACMDTIKDKQMFDEMELTGQTPSKVWQPPATADPRA